MYRELLLQFASIVLKLCTYVDHEVLQDAILKSRLRNYLPLTLDLFFFLNYLLFLYTPVIEIKFAYLPNAEDTYLKFNKSLTWKNERYLTTKAGNQLEYFYSYAPFLTDFFFSLIFENQVATAEGWYLHVVVLLFTR